MNLRRSVVRLVIAAVLAVAALTTGAAVGQVGDAREPVAQISADDTVGSPVGEGADGGSVTTTDGVTQARLGSTSLRVVTTSCPDSSRSETDLGLMSRMHVQSHCSFP